MEFTSLETGLATILGMVVAGIAVRLFLSSKYISKDECALHRESCEAHTKHFCIKIDELHRDLKDHRSVNKRQFDALFRMVRGIVVHGDMDKDVQEKILNQAHRGNDNGSEG